MYQSLDSARLDMKIKSSTVETATQPALLY